MTKLKENRLFLFALFAASLLLAPISCSSDSTEEGELGLQGKGDSTSDRTVIVLNESNSGQAVSLQPGDELSIQLFDYYYTNWPNQKDAGWFYKALNPDVFQLVNENEDLNNPIPTPSGRGKLVPHLFTFKILSNREATLQIDLESKNREYVIRSFKVVVTKPITVDSTRLYLKTDTTKNQQLFYVNPAETLTFAVENQLQGSSGTASSSGIFRNFKLLAFSSIKGLAAGSSEGCTTKIADPARLPVRFDETTGTGEFDLPIPPDLVTSPGILWVQAVLIKANTSGTCEVVTSSKVIQIVVRKTVKVSGVVPAVTPYGGNQEIRIVGENLYQINRVLVGTKFGTIKSKSTNELVVITPSYADKINMSDCYADPTPFRTTSFSAPLQLFTGNTPKAEFARFRYELSRGERVAREDSIQTAYNQAYQSLNSETHSFTDDATDPSWDPDFSKGESPQITHKELTMKSIDNIVFMLKSTISYNSVWGDVEYDPRLIRMTGVQTVSGGTGDVRYDRFDFAGTGNDKTLTSSTPIPTTIRVYKNYPGGWQHIHHFILDIKMIPVKGPSPHCGV